MQISQTFGKNFLVQSHQFASEKNSYWQNFEPWDPSYYKNTWDKSFAIEVSFYWHVAHCLQFFLTENIISGSTV